jgi:molybdopterin-guanine dinucleotide biosynthesis protein A
LRRLGAIIAGGQARRFGSDKGAALLAGKPLVEHVADALGPQVEALVIVGREWPGLEMLPDDPAGKLGPLAGLHAALGLARTLGLDGVLSAGCDTLPVFPDLGNRLCGPGPAFIEGQYLMGWWPTGLRPLLSQHLGGGADFSMRGWIACCGAQSVPAPLALFNLNTPEDLAAYQARLRQ